MHKGYTCESGYNNAGQESGNSKEWQDGEGLQSDASLQTGAEGVDVHEMQKSEIGKQIVHLSDEELEQRLFLPELVDRLLALPLHGTIVGVLHTHNDRLSDAVVPEKIVTIYGQDYIYEKILGLTFKISPFSFFQTN